MDHDHYLMIFGIKKSIFDPYNVFLIITKNVSVLRLLFRSRVTNESKNVLYSSKCNPCSFVFHSNINIYIRFKWTLVKNAHKLKHTHHSYTHCWTWLGADVVLENSRLTAPSALLVFFLPLSDSLPQEHCLSHSHFLIVPHQKNAMFQNETPIERKKSK